MCSMSSLLRLMMPSLVCFSLMFMSLKYPKDDSKQSSVLLGCLSLDLGDKRVNLVHLLRYLYRWSLDLACKSDVLFVQVVSDHLRRRLCCIYFGLVEATTTAEAAFVSLHHINPIAFRYRILYLNIGELKQHILVTIVNSRLV